MAKPASGGDDSQAQPSLFNTPSLVSNSTPEEKQPSTAIVEPIGAVLDRLGWRQGSIVPQVLYKHLTMDDTTISVEDADIAVVITGDCNLVHDDAVTEPVIEVVVGRTIEKFNGNYTRRKNPRQLHLKVDGLPDGAIGLEFEARRHGHLPRAILADTTPAQSPILLEESCRMIASWWAIGRYLRSSFPGAFNDRIRRLNTKRRFLERLLEARGNDIEAVYIRLLDERELPADKPYRMIVRVLIPESLMSDTTAWAAFDKETYGPLIELLDSDVGIDVIDHQAVSTKDFSYDDMLEMKPLEYEYLSFGGDEGLSGSISQSVPTRV